MSFAESLKQKEKKLLNSIKNSQDYTFSDDETDKKIMDSIIRGKKRINDIAGCEMDYNRAGEHKTLLINYCRYDLTGKIDEFERNYRSQIVALQIDKELEDYAGENKI